MHTDRSVGLAPIVLVPLVLGAALTLAGCSSNGTAPTPTPSRTTSASTPAPVTSSTPVPSSTPVAASTPASSTTPVAAGSASSCGAPDASTATAAAVAKLPAPTGLPQVRWDARDAITSTYQPCAALSAVAVPVEGSTASSPVAILLFHDGRYLGTATKAQYSFVPDLARTSDDAIAVTYHWVKPGESDAQSSGRTGATFMWDAAAGKVVMGGGVPPVS